MRFTADVAREASAIKSVSPQLTTAPQEKLLEKLCVDCALLSDRIDQLSDAIIHENRADSALNQARYQHDVILPAMTQVREVADELETMTDKTYWPFPTYADLLFRV